MPERFTYAWREEHARKGDEYLAAADSLASKPPAWSQATPDQTAAKQLHIQTRALLAAAHYQAANVRAKPMPEERGTFPGRDQLLDGGH